MRQTDTLLWTSRPTNRKTGAIPTAYVGRDPRAARKSCEAVACPLLGNGCYAWKGTLSQGHWSITKARQPRKGLPGLRWALSARGPVRSARIGALGDPATVRPSVLRRAVALLRNAGLSVLSYTHAWRRPEAQHLRRVAMASTEDDEGTERALSAGWRPAQVVPADADDSTYALPDGRRLVVCPTQRVPGVTCDDCRMCDPTAGFWERWARRGLVGIAFRKH